MPTRAEKLLERRYGNAGTRLRGRVIGGLVSLWRAMSGYREGDIATFTQAAVPIVLAGQQQTSALMTAFLAQQKSSVLGVPERVVRVPFSDVGGEATRGVDPYEVYQRPFQEVWKKLALGSSFDQAAFEGEQRLTKIAETDLQVTKIKTAQAVLADDKTVTGYRRVLVGDFNCALCTIAATQEYSKSDLLPIHPACDCSVAAVYDGEFDEDETLAAAHDAVLREFGKKAADGRAIDYRKIILTRDNSETGPTLTVAAHKFTAAQNLAARSSAGRRTGGGRPDTRAANLASLEANLPKLEARQAAGEDVGSQIDFHRGRISALKNQLGL